MEVISIGLDGANWDLLQPWLDAGDLPNIAALREEGVSADLESCLPPVTCPNWRCFSTGKNPGKLGVYWWEKIDTESRTLETPTSRSFRSADYWDYLNAEGYSVGIMNLPMTYPPYEVDGWMVAGGPGSEQTDYTHPPDLETELNRRGYRLHPDSPVTSNDDIKAARAVVNLIDQRFDTFKWLLSNRPVDIAHCTVFYSNVLQHFFYRGEPTKSAWEIIDSQLGELREEFPETTLILLSDHGCAEIETVFYANSWLEHEGYLATQDTAANSLGRLGLNQKRISKVTDRLGLRDIIARLTPERIKELFPRDEEGFKREQKLERIDWDRSSAIASGQGLIYVMSDHSDTVERIIDDLSSLTTESGRPVAHVVWL